MTTDKAAKTVSAYEFTLVNDKETAGTKRFSIKHADGHTLAVYLTNEQSEKLGSPKSVKVTIAKAS